LILLDTDTLTLHFHSQPSVNERLAGAQDIVAITIVSWIEVLRGRFDGVLKAADAAQLLSAQERLRDTEQRLSQLPVVAFDSVAAAEFDRLRANKKLKKIGRADLLIASIALAQRATLVTRNNVRHFRFRPVPGLALDNWAT
jgi:tRNA(fMet)-specific endonuclease VapC